MSRFFEPIEFVATVDPSIPVQKVTTWDPEKLKVAQEELTLEFEKFKSGTSEYSAYAVDPGRYGFPGPPALAAFMRNPSEKTLKTFEDAVSSSFGTRAGRAFADKLRATKETKEVSDGGK